MLHSLELLEQHLVAKRELLGHPLTADIPEDRLPLTVPAQLIGVIEPLFSLPFERVAADVLGDDADRTEVAICPEDVLEIGPWRIDLSVPTRRVAVGRLTADGEGVADRGGEIEAHHMVLVGPA